MAENEKPIFIGTVSYLLSHRSYHDFILGGMNVNQLPLLSASISDIQSSLDEIPAVGLRHTGGRAAFNKGASKELERYAPIEPFAFTLQNFFVESVSFESGSVYAKVKISAFVVFSAYQGLAAYKDVKEGFEELRSDIIGIVNDAFGVQEAGPVDGQPNQHDVELRYYFIQPRRIEEEILKRRLPPEQ